MTDKQKRFCEEYVVDLNATQAAIRAGYSPKTAEASASRLLSNVNVEKNIKELQKVASEKSGIDHLYILKKYKSLLELNTNKLVGLTLEELKALPEEIGMLIQDVKEVHFSDKTVYHLKMMDKSRAIESLGKHIGFFAADNNQKAGSTVILQNGIQLPLDDDE